jgi:hypothetical protein
MTDQHLFVLQEISTALNLMFGMFTWYLIVYGKNQKGPW